MFCGDFGGNEGKFEEIDLIFSSCYHVTDKVRRRII